jgi:hypothetical protein
MRRAVAWVLFVGLSGCYGPYDEGWDEGCYQGGLDGAMWGGADAALCYRSNPTPSAVVAGRSRFDEGYVDGYQSCYVDAYRDAWSYALYVLEEELGPCDELL